MPTMWLSDSQSKLLPPLTITTHDSRLTQIPEIGVAFCSGGRYANCAQSLFHIIDTDAVDSIGLC